MTMMMMMMMMVVVVMTVIMAQVCVTTRIARPAEFLPHLQNSCTVI